MNSSFRKTFLVHVLRCRWERPGLLKGLQIFPVKIHTFRYNNTFSGELCCCCWILLYLLFAVIQGKGCFLAYRANEWATGWCFQWDGLCFVTSLFDSRDQLLLLLLTFLVRTRMYLRLNIKNYQKYLLQRIYLVFLTLCRWQWGKYILWLVSLLVHALKAWVVYDMKCFSKIKRLTGLL